MYGAGRAWHGPPFFAGRPADRIGGPGMRPSIPLGPTVGALLSGRGLHAGLAQAGTAIVGLGNAGVASPLKSTCSQSQTGHRWQERACRLPLGTRVVGPALVLQRVVGPVHSHRLLVSRFIGSGQLESVPDGISAVSTNDSRIIRISRPRSGVPRASATSSCRRRRGWRSFPSPLSGAVLPTPLVRIHPFR